MTLLSQLVDEFFAQAINIDPKVYASSTYNLKDFSYVTTVNSDKLLTSITYLISMEVTCPGDLTQSGKDELKEVRLEVTLYIVNPGDPAEATLL